MSDAFSSLLAPLSVALVGASDDPTTDRRPAIALSQGVRFQGSPCCRSIRSAKPCRVCPPIPSIARTSRNPRHCHSRSAFASDPTGGGGVRASRGEIGDRLFRGLCRNRHRRRAASGRHGRHCQKQRHAAPGAELPRRLQPVGRLFRHVLRGARQSADRARVQSASSRRAAPTARILPILPASAGSASASGSPPAMNATSMLPKRSTGWSGNPKQT
jgi:hypothetical protein